MDNSRLTRPYLESLSTGELVRLADNCGIDIPYGLERVFIVEELLELTQDEELVVEAADTGVPRCKFKEIADLPKQYNISFIDVLIRDPLWVFVFWEIKEQDRKLHEEEPDFAGYCLRLIPLAADGTAAARETPFTVPVGLHDVSWYLGLPPGETRRYTVELCALRDSGGTVLAVSRPFEFPRLPETGGQYPSHLARLSGAADFPLTSSSERRFRARSGGKKMRR